MQSITFDHPAYWLLFLPLAALFWWIARRSNAPLAPDQRLQSLILRCIAAALIVAAIAGPVLRWDTHDQSVMYLVDVSRSISPAARAREFDLVRRALASKAASDSAGVIAFASDPEIVTRPSKTPKAPLNHVGINDETTDIGAAIRTASGALPASGSRQIVLISDGNETATATGSAMQAATAAGIPVSAVDPAGFLGETPPEASVARADLPPTVHEHEPVNVRAVVTSSTAQTAKLTVRADGRLLRTQTEKLSPGSNLVLLPITLDGSGVRQVQVQIDAPDDTLIENNRATALTQVIGKPRVLYLTDNPQRVAPTLQRAIQSQSISIDLKPATQAPRDVAGFAAYDSVVISNTPASELSPDQQNALQSAVRDFGVGLGMVGGLNSYIGGGWRDTPVEQALPVLMRPRQGEKLPPADVVVVLDASGSMAMEEDGVEKVQLGARAAVALLGTLQPTDRVAVISVTETPTVVVPFSNPKDALAAKKDIEGVEAGGGGIYCLTGLQAAYDLLDSSKAPIKHVVICPDTSDSEQQEHCVELARTMRLTAHVTTSVCGIGSWRDRDVTFQKQLAEAGGGQLYVVNQASDLPQFFQRDLSHFQAPPFLEGVFLPRITAGDKVLAGLNTTAEPPLLGYNIVAAKPEATVAMRAPQHPDPLLAYQTFGLGHTFAFTSDETDHWAAKWLPWQGYDQFWSQLLRWSLRGGKPANFQAFADLSGGSGVGHVVVDAFSSGGSFLNGAAFTAMIASPTGGAKRLALTQTAPGRYEAQFPAAQTGEYLLTVSRDRLPDDGIATLGVAQPYLAEFAQVGANMPLLTQLADATGGRILSDAASAWRFRPQELPGQRSLAAALLLLGTLLFILDIAWRRLGLRIRPQRVVAPALTVVAATANAGASVAQAARDTRERAAQAKRARTAVVDDAAFLSRPVGWRVSADDEQILRRRPAADDSFPLVASLDDLRRRERAKDKDEPRSG